MKTILTNIEKEIVIKNSRFICYLYPILDEAIDSILKSIKEMHPKATHYCYAYIYDDVFRFSDDGEPGGTAGIPILNVLQKEDYNHVLAVVVRYFGGIKLGSGGLVRAYTKSVTEALKEVTIQEMVEGYKIFLHFPYEEENNVLYLLNNSFISSKEYLEDITYTCYVSNDIYDKLVKYHPTILEKCYIKKLNES